MKVHRRLWWAFSHSELYLADWNPSRKIFIAINFLFSQAKNFVHKFVSIPGTDFVDPIGYAELDFFNSE